MCLLMLCTTTEARIKKHKKLPPVIELELQQIHFQPPPWCSQLVLDYRQMFMTVRCMVFKT